MIVFCTWCRKEIKLLSKIPSIAKKGSQYICADCIIPLLPQSLINPEAQETAPDETEKRQVQRFPAVSQIYLSSKAKRHSVTQALILDISDLGMKVKVKDKLEIGEKITLGFFGTETAYKVMGEIVREQSLDENDETFFELGIKLFEVHQSPREMSQK